LAVTLRVIEIRTVAHVWAVLVCSTLVASAQTSFRHDVLTRLSKAGCNTGACHGSGHGKGNLKLSLRGENPDLDFLTLTQSRSSKRLNVAAPDESFLLKKPLEIVEHEGGKRLHADSDSFRVIRAWIAEGAPLDPADRAPLVRLEVTPDDIILTAPVQSQALKAIATYGDGTTRDVSHLACYEPNNFVAKVSSDGIVTANQPGETVVMTRLEHLHVPVRLAFIPERPEPVIAAAEHPIDQHISAKLTRLRIEPSGLCDDSTFLRRAHLEITGVAPTAEEARAFLRDPAPDKRARLVDALLASPAYADWWAQKWADLFRLEERVLDRTGTIAFYRWIRDRLAADVPMDEFVREILSAEGSTYQNPPANYFRALREPTLRAEATAQVFLGTRLSCAKCHNHPFERWTQNDYYRFSAVFDTIDYTILKDERSDENDKGEFIGEQVIARLEKPTLKDPRDATHPPRHFLGEAQPVESNARPLAAMAAWMTRRDHPLFAQVMANRVWAHLMGRGIVDPVDDFRLTNPPSNPALLASLTVTFQAGGSRLKPLIRHICLSQAWQRSSTPTASNADDTVNFSKAIIRRWSAETLCDALHTALGVPFEVSAYPDVTRAGALPGARFITRSRRPTATELFLKEFGKPPRTTACDCERTIESSLSQVFTLTSGPGVSALLSDPQNRLHAWMGHDQPASDVVDALFWTFLSRAPQPAEIEKLTAYLNQAPDRRAALEDMAWSVINSKEFLLRH
jgi:hypothetical protein